MERTTRWLVAGMLATLGTGCAQLRDDGATGHREAIDGVPAGSEIVRAAAPRAAPPGESAGGADERRTRRAAGGADDAAHGIAADFVHAFVQIAGHAPGETSVSFALGALETDPVTAALEPLMRERGYAVRIVDDATGGDVAHVADEDARAAATVHTVSIGGVQLRRSYRTTADGRWSPAGPLFVRGADASGIRMDRPDGDDDSPPAAPSTAPRSADNAGELVAEVRASPVPRRVAPKATPIAMDETSGKVAWSGLASARSKAPALPRALTANRAELGDSNFADVFDAYGDVDELILTFPNDSLVLGERNKARIRRTLEGFDRERDTFSIVGCSFGRTAIAHGNEALALGRANRVKEELLFAGVPRDRIFEEGCWAGEAAVKFPSRGVVLTHKRHKGA